MENPPLKGEGRTAEGSPGWGAGSAADKSDAVSAEALSPPPGPLNAGRPPPSRGRRYQCLCPHYDAPSCSLYPHRRALPDADAHGGQGKFAGMFFEAMHGGEHKARPRHAEGMPQRDGAAVGVHVLGIIGKAKLAQTGE